MLCINKKRDEKIQFDIEVNGKVESFTMDTTMKTIQGKKLVHFVFDAPQNVKITRVKKDMDTAE